MSHHKKMEMEMKMGQLISWWMFTPRVMVYRDKVMDKHNIRAFCETQAVNVNGHHLHADTTQGMLRDVTNQRHTNKQQCQMIKGDCMTNK